MEQENKAKGNVSNCIAWVFITLQIMLIVGGLFARSSPNQGANVSFRNGWEMFQSVIYIFGINILGIGALVLSLIVWLHHKNLKGKITTIVATIVIIVNTLVPI